MTTVLLPGTGSDHDYVRRAFAPALRRTGAVLVTPPPQPHRLIAGYRDALDAAAGRAPIAVGGVSIGAAVAAAWALAHPERVIAVLAALPAWSGEPGGCPAALAARHSAMVLRRDGIESAIAQMRADSPRWLGDELARSWRAQWPALPDAMEQAAAYVAPTARELSRLVVPMGVAAASDDPVHPIAVAEQWVAAAPRAALRAVTLDEMGADPAVLGAACVAAVRAAAGSTAGDPGLSRR
ncbi:alpha/beta hydrolase family protein [Mycolicibacterium hassiacum DSM 44199]|uniref:Alpha/beta hydrolase family protein n=1 Tax=Mycolicibacterium hassiacum (strain DSM 44199 / CIP 105218 / JCM 12690 / 3849) TaxID=1122247 RepID=K5BFR6_MYCHD|nr:alpha/beta hydrolase family protein [Mycolicibacterium hassiacum DSM 44199]MDA4085113.1 hypothetical protein [Mycolicibacterium hassiacum DSM 44199]VCT90624.1 hypothetical protein MHAS_02333 [Mycolicibacterium hassiacum DSM 44199]